MEIQPLSIHGNSDYTKQKMDTILNWYVYSNKSQSLMFYGNVKSLKNDILISDSDVYNLKNNITDSLTELYMAYFEDDEVNITVMTEETDANIYINIDIEVYNESKSKTTKLDIVYNGSTIISASNEILDLYYNNVK